jgi:hypothetical protein
MDLISINTKQELTNWLEENGNFEEAHCVEISPLPHSSDSPVPSEVIIVLKYLIEGNFKAFTPHTYRVIRVTCHSVQEFTIEDNSFNAKVCIDGIQMLDVEDLGIQSYVPSLLTLICKSIAVEELPSVIESREPWLSNRDIWVEVSNESKPSPKQWRERFLKMGQNVEWHIYSTTAKDVNDVPIDDYDGWFLQYPEVDDLARQGVFFSSCNDTAKGFNVSLSNHGASAELWEAVKEIIGSFTDALIHCGNCEFSSMEWNKVLSTKTLNFN